MTRLTLPQQRAQETRQRIIDAGQAVFGRCGCTEPTVEEIAGEAGVSIGAFYHHFPSKADLFKAILEEHLGGAFIEFHEILRAASFREMIERFVAAWFHHVATTPAFNSLVHQVSGTHETWAIQALATFHLDGARAIARVLALAQRFGLVRESLDPAVGATVILMMMEGIESLWVVDRSSVDSTTFKAAWADSIDRYIAADGPGNFAAFQAEAGSLFPPGATG